MAVCHNVIDGAARKTPGHNLEEVKRLEEPNH